MTSVGSDKAANNIHSYDTFRGKSSVHGHTTTMVSNRSSSGEESFGNQQEEINKSRPDSPTTTYVTKRLEASTRPEVKRKIDEIVASTQKFNDLEKLLLYLKLPTGSSLCTKPNKDKSSSQVLSNRSTHWRGLNWIRTHLEESVETSLSKQDIYDDYRHFCEMSNYQVLSAADFGKLVKQVFPNIKVRRLGTRGNSKYCYSGINKKTEVRPPSLPNLDSISTHKVGHGSILGADQQINDSANFVVCEWASKRIGCAFTSVVDLAKHLVSTNKVQGKSAAAFNLLVEHPSKQLLHRVRTGALTHKETQLHLRGTIQRRQMQKQEEASKHTNLKSLTPTPKQVEKSKSVEPVELVCSDYQLKIDSDSGHSRGSDSSFSGSDVATDHDNSSSSPKKFCSSTAVHQNNMDNKDRSNPKESPNTRKLKPLMPKTPISEAQRQVFCVMSSPMAGSQMTGTQARQPTTPVTPVLQVNDQTYVITLAPTTNTAILQDVKTNATSGIDTMKKLPNVASTSIPASSQQGVSTSKPSNQTLRTAIVGSPCSAASKSTSMGIGERGLVVSVPVQNKTTQQGNIHKVALNNTQTHPTPNIPTMPVFSIQQISSSSESALTSTAPMISCMSPVVVNSSPAGALPVSIAVPRNIQEQQAKNQGITTTVKQSTVGIQQSGERKSQDTQQEQSLIDNSSSAALLKLIGLQNLPQQQLNTSRDNHTTVQENGSNKCDRNNSILHDMLVLQNNGNVTDWQNPCSSPSLQVLNSTIPRASSANVNVKMLKPVNSSQVDINISNIYNIQNAAAPVIATGSASVPSSPSYISQSQLVQASGQPYVIQTLTSPAPSDSGNVFSFTPIANTTGILQNGIALSPKPMPKPKATMGVKLDLSEQNPQLVMCQEAPRQVPKTARQELIAKRGGQANIRPVRHRRVSASSRKKFGQAYNATKTTIGAGVLTSPGSSRSATPVSPMVTNPNNIQFFQSESESMPPPSPNPLKIEVSPCVSQASNLLNNRIDSSTWGRQRRLSGPPAQFSMTNVSSQLTSKNLATHTAPVSQRSQSVPLPDLGFDALLPKYQSVLSSKEGTVHLPQLPQLQVISISEEDFLVSDNEETVDVCTSTSVSASDKSILEHWDLDGEDPVLTNSNAANTMLTSTLSCNNTATDDVTASSFAQDNILQQINANSSFSGSDNSIDMETTDSFDASTWTLGHFPSLPCGS